jgi:hypothetical protein
MVLHEIYMIIKLKTSFFNKNNYYIYSITESLMLTFQHVLHLDQYTHSRCIK